MGQETEALNFYDSAIMTIGQASYGSIALGIAAFLILHFYTRATRNRRNREDVRSVVHAPNPTAASADSTSRK